MSHLLPLLLGSALLGHLLMPSDDDNARRTLGRASALLILFVAPSGWLLTRLLRELSLDHLQLLILLPAVAALASLCLRLVDPSRRRRLWFPVLANGSSLAVAQQAAMLDDLSAVLLCGLLAGLGFWLVLQLLGDLLARADSADVPAPLRGTPLALIGAGLMGLVLLGVVGR